MYSYLPLLWWVGVTLNLNRMVLTLHKMHKIHKIRHPRVLVDCLLGGEVRTARA